MAPGAGYNVGVVTIEERDLSLQSAAQMKFSLTLTMSFIHFITAIPIE